MPCRVIADFDDAIPILTDPPLAAGDAAEDVDALGIGNLHLMRNRLITDFTDHLNRVSYFTIV